jgi:hypothetical protein
MLVRYATKLFVSISISKYRLRRVFPMDGRSGWKLNVMMAALGRFWVGRGLVCGWECREVLRIWTGDYFDSAEFGDMRL